MYSQSIFDGSPGNLQGIRFSAAQDIIHKSRSESQDANDNDSIEDIIQALKSFNMKTVANRWHVSGALVAGRHI